MRAIKTIQWLAMATILAIVAGCSQGEPVTAWKMINDGALLVDVRTPGEFKQGHLPGAKLIPVSEVESRLAEFGEDKSKPIVVYCKSGMRSGKAEGILREKGYTNVLNGGGYSALMSSKP
ncbi:MAG TPA: rhodanese-like domain-containing protein [Candidatus Tenderia electrophaga]|uniref:Rhodanese-like domain-containing protein n=1 Tax=Candidatus Tenderia electrophaga TaxID=1748243 RepID=A0A832J5M0_9GAMM|nr:rhodanese-like domain-containing protein [Candidatus Tenderia electrophaga]